MDEDWYAVGQAIYKGAEGAELEKLHNKCVEVGRAVNVRHPSTSHKDKTLWKVSEACHDQDSERKIDNRVAVRQALWEEHLQNRTMKPCESADPATVAETVFPRHSAKETIYTCSCACPL